MGGEDIDAEVGGDDNRDTEVGGKDNTQFVKEAANLVSVSVENFSITALKKTPKYAFSS